MAWSGLAPLRVLQAFAYMVCRCRNYLPYLASILNRSVFAEGHYLPYLANTIFTVIIILAARVTFPATDTINTTVTISQTATGACTKGNSKCKAIKCFNQYSSN